MYKRQAYNEEHGIVPTTIVKGIRDSLEISDHKENAKLGTRRMSKAEREQLITLSLIHICPGSDQDRHLHHFGRDRLPRQHYDLPAA